MTMLAYCNNAVMNDGVRKGGFAASQWVLGKYPRSPGDMFDENEFADLGCVTEKIDGVGISRTDADATRMQEILC